MTRDPFELGTDGPRVIVVGVDGSDSSRRAAAYAIGMARRNGSRLLAVHIQSTVPAAVGLTDWTGAVGGVADAARRIQSDIEVEIHRQLADDATAWGTQFVFVVRAGDAAAELIAVAREAGADAIVLGAPEHRIHRLAGSLSSRVLRRGPWLVTVVP